MEEEELRPIPSRGWAEMIRKVYEVDPMGCPECGGQNPAELKNQMTIIMTLLGTMRSTT
jgi:transposase